MLKRKDRALERYMKIGAEMRLYKTLSTTLAVDLSRVVSKTDLHILMRAQRKIEEICSRAEDNMFRDHPQLSDEYLDVFYGSTEMEPRSDVDRRVLKLAKETADELFTGKRR